MAAKPPDAGRAVRLGGMVEKGSIKTEADGVTIDFRRRRRQGARCRCASRGIVPDLFTKARAWSPRASCGADGTFVADNLLAKHDENYVPRELKDMTGAQAKQVVAETQMIAEVGLAALWLAAALALLQLVAGALCAARGGERAWRASSGRSRSCRACWRRSPSSR